MNKKQNIFLLSILILFSVFYIVCSFLSSGNPSIAANSTSIISRLHLPPASSQLAALEDASSGLVGWWRFDENSGSTLYDSSGNGNNATIVNGPTRITGKVGNGALDFNGQNDVVKTGSFAIPGTNNAITFSTWFNSKRSTNLMVLFSDGSQSKTSPYIMLFRPASSDGLSWQYVDGSGSYGNARSPTDLLSGLDDQWVHIIVVADYANKKVDWYRNGALVGTFNSPNSIYFPSGNNIKYLGDYNAVNGGNPFKGKLDEVRVYSRALSPDEILSLFNFTSSSSGNQSVQSDPSGQPNQPVQTNQPPIVSAGNAQTITLPAIVNLNGTASDDNQPNNPSTLFYAWSKVSGAGNVTFSNSGLISTTARFSTPGTYVLRLSVSDSVLTTNSDVTITVNPANTELLMKGMAYDIFTVRNLTREQIVTDVAKLKNTGINTVFVWIGTLYAEALRDPAKYAARAPNAKWDSLKALIEIAHENGIAVHLWYSALRGKNLGAGGGIIPAFEQHPDWQALGRDLQPNKDTIDLSNPEARAYEENLILYLVGRYRPEGVHIEEPYFNRDEPYTDSFRNLAKSNFGVDPYLTPSVDVMGKTRILVMDTFFKELRASLKKNYPSILLSANGPSVVTTSYYGYDLLGWTKNGYLDFYLPQIYTTDSGQFSTLLNNMIIKVGASVPVYPFIGVSWDSLLKSGVTINPSMISELAATKESGIRGAVLFRREYLNDQDLLAVKNVVNANSSISPPIITQAGNNPPQVTVPVATIPNQETPVIPIAATPVVPNNVNPTVQNTTPVSPVNSNTLVTPATSQANISIYPDTSVKYSQVVAKPSSKAFKPITNLDNSLLIIPTTTIDIAVPKVPSWLEVLIALFKEIVNRVKMGAGRTIEEIRLLF